MASVVHAYIMIHTLWEASNPIVVVYSSTPGRVKNHFYSLPETMVTIYENTNTAESRAPGTRINGIAPVLKDDIAVSTTIESDLSQECISSDELALQSIFSPFKGIRNFARYWNNGSADFLFSEIRLFDTRRHQRNP